MPGSSLGAEWPRASGCMLQEGLEPRVCGAELRRPRDFACCASSFFPPRIQAHVASCLNVDRFLVSDRGHKRQGALGLCAAAAGLSPPAPEPARTGPGGQRRLLQGAVSWASQAALAATSSPVSAGHRRLALIPGSGGPLLKEMARTLCVLAWEVPWTGEPGGLHNCKRVK